MTATTLQIAIMAIVLVYLLWLAMRPGRRSDARRPSSGHSWSEDSISAMAAEAAAAIEAACARSGIAFMPVPPSF